MDGKINLLDLPTEVIVKVLSYLGLQDRKNVALVNKAMDICCRDKSLMQDIMLYTSIENLPHANQSQRFDNLIALNLSDQILTTYTKCWRELLVKLKVCELVSCRLSRAFLHHFLNQVSKETKLKKLNLRNTGVIHAQKSDNLALSYVPVVLKLDEINFWGSSLLEGEHLRYAFKQFERIGSMGNLKILNLGCIDTLCCLEPRAFGQILNKLNVLNIRNSTITKDQFQCLLSEMVAGTRLKILKMGNNTIFRKFWVDNDLLATALNNVEELELWPNEFTFQQMLALLLRIGQEGAKLKKFFLDEDTDRYMAARYPEVYPDLRVKISHLITFTLLPY